MVTEHTVPYLSVEHRALSFVHSLMQDKPFHPGGAAALDSMASYAAKHGALDPQKSTDIGDYNGLRADRWRQRRTVRRVLKGTRVASCGRPVSKETGVGLYYDAKHGSRFSGLRSCGSVWACPVCNHKIQSSRLDDVTAVMEHCKEHGWGVVFGTLTVRHKRKDTLKEVSIWRVRSGGSPAAIAALKISSAARMRSATSVRRKSPTAMRTGGMCTSIATTSSIMS